MLLYIKACKTARVCLCFHCLIVELRMTIGFADDYV
ncbi:hypothetical protein Pint_15256 [Pistacia integerrima]|uniref:Uncharacterized protein n=1 Tax=Pistacia integerrima TaxID=434235 RepID=A0ACC0ZAQ3_9ROSI|nr:hypothetical protein Pint_15256 [Pistacia integerrima]